MKAQLNKLCIHTITTQPWPLDKAIAEYQAHGVPGITVWRQALEGFSAAKIGDQIRTAGMQVVSLCRGGFFPAPDARDREAAIQDNLLAIEQTAELGAPLIVLVPGAVPGQPLEKSRAQIREGIETILPRAMEHGIQLGIEPLHPMYADSRSAINSLKQANDMCDQIDSPNVGVIMDVYHLWWEPNLQSEIERCGQAGRIFAFHICDWKTPTRDLLNDRGLMGEGCIDIPQIRAWVENNGFDGYHEVEIFSDQYWQMDQREYLKKIIAAYKQYG
jgi:sugar phosphate isomerase/epimerase